MADEYCRSVLRVSLAQICQNLGWNAAQATPLELLTDVLERYLLEVAKVTHRYSEQFGRTDPNLDDLGLAFRHLGVQLGELEDYVQHVDPLPFAQDVVSFPAPKRNNLRFPRADSREVLQREEHVPEHLPPMFPEEIEPAHSPTPHVQPADNGLLAPPPTTPMAASPSDIQVDGPAVSPGLSDKRLLTSPPSGGPPSKRIRLTNLPEEAAHSQYEMKSMAMNVAGEVMPTGGYIGKLPDAKTPPQGFPKRFPKDNTRGSSSKSAPLLSVARDILSELNSKKDSNEGPQKKDKDKSYSNSSSKKSGVKKKSNNGSEKKDISKKNSKVKKNLLTPKPRSRSRSKSPARAKSPKGGGNKKGQNKVPSDSGAGLFSETIMLERQKGPDKVRASSPVIKNKDEPLNMVISSNKNKDSPRSTPLDLSFKKVSKPTDLEEKKRRLDAIQSSIDSVLRKSALSAPECDPDISDKMFAPLEMEEDIEEPRITEKVKVEEGSKPVDKLKEFSTSSSIDDTINAVIGSVDRTDTPTTPVSLKEDAVDSSAIISPPDLPSPPVVTTPGSQTSPRKKGRPPKKKSKGNKKPGTPPFAPPVVAEQIPPVEPRSPKDEKFAVFDFPESPPMRSISKPTVAPPAAPPPVVTPRSPSPPPPVVESALVVPEEPHPPPAEESLVKVEVDDTAQVTPTPEKSHSKEKEKHKSKEHKKEKKEKKKDKEKKKKNKDKDRDKERSKHKDKSSKSPSTFPAGLTKLKIRLGSSPFSSTVTYSSEAKDRSPSGSPAQRPEIPKLVIKPMPPLPSSQEKGSDSPKSSSSSKSSKKEGKSKKDVSHIVVKKEAVPEKLPPTPPAIARTPSPAPVAAKTPSPVKKTPSPVPIKREPSPVPPPKPATPVPTPKSAITVPKFVGSDSPERSSYEEPLVLKMEMIEEPPVLTPQPSPRRHQTPTPPPARNPTPPRVPTIKSSPVPSPKHSPSPSRREYSPSPPRVNSPPTSAFTSKSMSSSPVKTPSPSRTRTPSPIPSLPPSPIHQPSPSPTPTKPPTPSPTPTPAHSPSPGPLVIKEAPVIPPMPPPSIGTASQAAVSAKTALQRTVTSETIGSFIDASSGEKIWICPACKRQDDGSPMVGCDICDDWYHWECIGINKEPEEDSWYCNKCVAPTRKPSKRGRGSGRGRGRGRGRKKSLKD